MNKRIIILTMCLILTLVLIGCRAEVVSVVPIDTEFTEAYDEQRAKYKYKYIWLGDRWEYIFVGFETVHHDDKYRVKYQKTYADGYVNEYWETVTEEEYRQAVKHIEEGRQ